VLGCPEVSAPNGSYVSNGTLTSRTFLCKSGSVFPDSKERKRTLECRNGKWNETATKLPDCIGKNLPVRFITLRSALSLFLRITFYIFYLSVILLYSRPSANPCFIIIIYVKYRVTHFREVNKFYSQISLHLISTFTQKQRGNKAFYCVQ